MTIRLESLQNLNTDKQLNFFLVCFIFKKKFLAEEARDELEKNVEQVINRDNLIYKTCTKKKSKRYDFQKFKTIRYFGEEI